MLEFLKQNKKIVAIAIIIVILFVVYLNSSKEEYTLDENLNTSGVTTSSDENIIIIHITGAVKNPGVVKLAEGSRIEDAIELAGGLNDDADVTNVNLAYVVEDGTKIRIPSENDENSLGEEYITDDSGIEMGDIGESLNSNSGVININKAEQSELETLPGIGPSLATKIIEYREQNGKFKDIQDIKNVNRNR